jgi:hypothetical protein
MLNKTTIRDIPDLLIENDIFPYLTSHDLFYSVRGVSTDWAEIMRSIWGGKLKDEMIDQVKSIDFLYEKELLTKTYEFKIKYLFNYKGLLTAYNTNANIYTLVLDALGHISDDQIKKLITLFFAFTDLDEPNIYIQNNEYEELADYLRESSNYEVYKTLIASFMDLEVPYKDLFHLHAFKQSFSELSKEYLENISENAKLVYSFLLGLIEFQILKVEVKDIKDRIENLIKRIHDQTLLWPKKKNFFEKAYKIILFTKNSSSGINKMVELYEDNKIRHPLIDFNDEALKIILNLKIQLNTETFTKMSIDDTIYENILQRRIQLTKKLFILENFYNTYKQYKINDEDRWEILDEKFNIKELLWCMKFSSNSEQEKVTAESIVRTKKYLDKHFDFEKHIIYANEGYLDDNSDHSPKRLCNDCKPKNEYIDYELEEEMNELGIGNEEVEEKPRQVTQEEIDTLREEKEKLELQKQKTEEILTLLRRFVELKENMLTNKKKYKTILGILTQVRAGNLDLGDRDALMEIIDNMENEGVGCEETITESERQELDNIDNIEIVLNEIETGIMRQVKEIFNNSENNEL